LPEPLPEPEAPPLVPPPIIEPPLVEAPPVEAPTIELPDADVNEAVTETPVEIPNAIGWHPLPELWVSLEDYREIDWGIWAIDIKNPSIDYIVHNGFVVVDHGLAPTVAFDGAPQMNSLSAGLLRTSLVYSKNSAMMALGGQTADSDGLVPEPSGLALAGFALAVAGRWRPPRRAAI
jgi:hypothetical protein